MPLFLIICLLIWFLPAPSSQAGSTLGLEIISSAGAASAARYNPFAPGKSRLELSVRVTHDGDPTRAILKASTLGVRSGKLDRDGESLEYQWTTEDGRSFNSTTQLPVELLRTEFRAGAATRDLKFYLEIPSGQVVSPGIYASQVQLTLAEETPSGEVQRQNRSVWLRMPVQEIIEVSVASRGAAASGSLSHPLEFGTLESGKELSCQLQIRGNVRFQLQVESENRGQMKNQNTTLGGAIPYEFHFDGAPVTLASGIPNALRPRQPFLAVQNTEYPIRVVIGDVKNLPAGKYRDVVLLSVTAE